MKISIGVKTDVGRARERNEDSYLVQAPLFGVADGMGGHVAGDVASQTAVKVIVDSAAESPPDSPDDLEEYVLRANKQIWEKANGDRELKGMGTTCTLVYITGSTAHFAHVGDSRAYLLRNGELSQVTEDHTLVQRMVKEGRLRQEEAASHPQRNIISRVLGVDSDVHVDLLTLELVEGDRILINSDGLSSMIDDDTIRRILSDAASPDDAAENLVEAANEAGGEDNITVVILEAQGDDAPDPVPVRSTTEPRRVEPPVRDEIQEARAGEPRFRLGRTLLISAIVILVLAGGGYAAARYALANSWFVGTNSAGFVAIYKGIPDEVAGVTLKEEVRATTIALDDLPPFLQPDVEEGIKKDSLADAEATLVNFRELIKNFNETEGGGGTDSGGTGTKNDGNK